MFVFCQVDDFPEVVTECRAIIYMAETWDKDIFILFENRGRKAANNSNKQNLKIHKHNMQQILYVLLNLNFKYSFN